MSAIVEYNVPLVVISCNTCKHYNRKEFSKFSCNAFENIPKEILIGNNKHLLPLKEQTNNITYEEE